MSAVSIYRPIAGTAATRALTAATRNTADFEGLGVALADPVECNVKQTPQKIGFIGAGRIAHGLAVALTRAGYPVSAVASRSTASAQDFAAHFTGCAALTPQALADTCDFIFLTVPDDSIAPVAQSLTWRAGQSLVHCSGATEVSALAPAAAAGAMTGGFHPLQSFSFKVTPDAAKSPLAGCTITIEAGPPLIDTLIRMVTAFECRPNRLPPGKRALYHASAGYAAGFIHGLMAEIATVWSQWDATEADVLAVALPMIRATADAMERGGIAATMPGPISRGDLGSVTAHIEALSALSPEALTFYRAHATRSIALARAADRIDAATAAKLTAIVDSSD